MVKCFCEDWRSNKIRCIPTTIEEDSKTLDISSQWVPIPRLFSWSHYLIKLCHIHLLISKCKHRFY